MSIEVKVPQLPESVSDATLVTWHKAVGDTVNRDENLVDLETDKVMLEVPAPASGVLREIRIEDGATVTGGETLAVIEEGEATAAAGPSSGEPGDETSSVAEPPSSGVTELPAGHKLSPAVRRLVEEHALDASAIRGTGRQGRITKSDVMSHLQKMEAHPAAEPAAAPTRPQVEVPAGGRGSPREWWRPRPVPTC